MHLSNNISEGAVSDPPSRTLGMTRCIASNTCGCKAVHNSWQRPLSPLHISLYIHVYCSWGDMLVCNNLLTLKRPPGSFLTRQDSLSRIFAISLSSLKSLHFIVILFKMNKHKAVGIKMNIEFFFFNYILMWGQIWRQVHLFINHFKIEHMELIAFDTRKKLIYGMIFMQFTLGYGI